MNQPCCKGMRALRNVPGYPLIPLVFPFAMAVISTMIALWMTERFTRATEITALTSVLDDMKDELSDEERAEVLRRIREKL